MKILLLADIHANIHALEAIWAREGDSDLVWCAGDLVDWGPWPREVIAWMKARETRCVRGNHDDEVIAAFRSGKRGRLPGWPEFTAGRVSEGEIRYLESLPETEVLPGPDGPWGMTHLFRDYEEIVSVPMFEAFRKERFADAPGMRRLIFGHTHRQAVRRLAGGLSWLNPGSVSYRRPDDPDQSAHYATMVDGKVSLHRLEYDTRPVYDEVARLRLSPECSFSAWFFHPATEVQPFPAFFDRYEKAWRRVETEWDRRRPGTRLWLTYSANYLFRSNGLAWAVDPLLPHTLLGRAYPVEIPGPLRELEVILLTHRHPDHWDETLLRRLAGRARVWLVPEFLAGSLRDCGVRSKEIVVLKPGESWNCGDFSATVCEGRHWEPGGPGIDSASWQVTVGGKRLMFFGDVRAYDPALYDGLAAPDAAFAHVWLGRGEARTGAPDRFEPFCRFHERFSPRRILLTHLDEWSRDEGNRWTARHAARIEMRLRAENPGLEVTTPGLLSEIAFP